MASKYYTRIIGIAFLAVILSLAFDYWQFGFRPESMHKIFHVALGFFVVYFGWNSKLWWHYFPLVNGLFFSFVAVFGILFFDFAGLDAFNRVDTILHSIVGLMGIGSWALNLNDKKW